MAYRAHLNIAKSYNTLFVTLLPGWNENEILPGQMVFHFLFVIISEFCQE